MRKELIPSTKPATATGKPEKRMSGRRHFLQFAALSAGSAVVAACGGTTAPKTNPNAGLTPEPKFQAADGKAVSATMTASVNKSYFPSGDPNVPDAYVGPWPMFQSVFFKPGHGDTVKVFGPQLGTPVTPHDQNRFWQELEKRLNVKWDLNQVPFTAYGEKAAALLASGDMPDLFFIDFGHAPSLQTAILQGAFTDLTPYLTGSALNDYPNLARFPQQTWTNMQINGKIYGVPRPRAVTGSTLFYRKDWLDKFGLAVPKSTTEFMNMLKAFTQNDPDGNGHADTWGWGFNGADTATAPYLSQFFMNIFGVPNNWQLDIHGKLTYYIETPQFKEAVNFMRQIYAAGYVYPDSLVQNFQQGVSNFNAGKYGVDVDGFTALYGYQTNTKKLVPTADVQVMIPFGANGHKPNHWFSSGFFGFTGIPTSAGKDPNRVKELLRVMNYLSAPPFSEEATFLSSGIDGWDNTVAADGTRTRTQTGFDEIGTLVYIANGTVVYTSTDNLARVQQNYARQLLSMGVKNPVASLTSTTMGTQGSVLAELMNDRVNRVIKGTDPVSALDDLVTLWNQQGGATIKQEYEQALQSHKK